MPSGSDQDHNHSSSKSLQKTPVSCAHWLEMTALERTPGSSVFKVRGFSFSRNRTRSTPSPGLWVRAPLKGRIQTHQAPTTTPAENNSFFSRQRLCEPGSQKLRGRAGDYWGIGVIGSQEGWVSRGHTESLRQDISQGSAIIRNSPIHPHSYIYR